MKSIGRLLVYLVANAIGIGIAAYFIEGVSIDSTIEAYLKAAALLTIGNLLVRPILKIVLGPLIIITLGLGIIVVNALILYGVDYISTDITITGLYPLVYATLILAVINGVFSYSAKKTQNL